MSILNVCMHECGSVSDHTSIIPWDKMKNESSYHVGWQNTDIVSLFIWSCRVLMQITGNNCLTLECWGMRVSKDAVTKHWCVGVRMLFAADLGEETKTRAFVHAITFDGIKLKTDIGIECRFWRVINEQILFNFHPPTHHIAIYMVTIYYYFVCTSFCKQNICQKYYSHVYIISEWSAQLCQN